MQFFFCGCCVPQAKKLSAELRAVHVTTDGLLQDQSELSVQARQFTVTGQVTAHSLTRSPLEMDLITFSQLSD